MPNQSVKEEFDALQVEIMRDQVAKIRRVTANYKHRRERLLYSMSKSEGVQRADQAACKHRKGGKGVDRWRLNGSATEYAVITHTTSDGRTAVFCTRCGIRWEAPDKNLMRRGATPEERSQYKKQLETYRWALSLPTDNEPSGTTLFQFTPFDPSTTLEAAA